MHEWHHSAPPGIVLNRPTCKREDGTGVCPEAAARASTILVHPAPSPAWIASGPISSEYRQILTFLRPIFLKRLRSFPVLTFSSVKAFYAMPAGRQISSERGFAVGEKKEKSPTSDDARRDAFLRKIAEIKRKQDAEKESKKETEE